MAPRKEKSPTSPDLIKVEVPEGSAIAQILSPSAATSQEVSVLRTRVAALEDLVDSALSDIEDLQSSIASHTDEIEGLQRKALNPRQETAQEPSHGPMVAMAVGIASLFSAITGGQR